MKSLKYIRLTLFIILMFLTYSAKLLSAEIVIFNQQGKHYSIPKGKFPKWDSMRLRWKKSSGLTDDQCEAGLFNRCYLKDLSQLILSIQSEGDWKKIVEINEFVNELSYQEDIRTYGVADYWAITHEFFDNEQGDCEDYSITKYYALKDLGFKVDDLLIAIVKDIVINVYHAILFVKYNGSYFVLDNRLYDVTPSKAIKHYRMVYAINENGWWFFK